MKTTLDYLVDLNPKTSVLTSQEKLRRHMQMGWGEAGTGVMGPQAKEHFGDTRSMKRQRRILS